MDSQVTVPSVALIINLSGARVSDSQAEKATRLASTMCGLGISATWVLDALQQAKWVENGQLAATAQELALTVSARSPQRLRSDLTSCQTALQAKTRPNISVISGDPQQLRARAALLADLGIKAVISSSDVVREAKLARPLPCGLWQIDPTFALPQPRRWSLLPARRLTVEQLKLAKPAVISIDLGLLGSRDLQSCQRLMEEVAESRRQQQLSVVTVSEVATQLTAQHEVKPQRSILRRAA